MNGIQFFMIAVLGLVLAGCEADGHTEVQHVIEVYDTGITGKDDTLIRHGDHQVELKGTGGTIGQDPLMEEDGTYWLMTGMSTLWVAVEDGELDVIHDVDEEIVPTTGFAEDAGHLFYAGAISRYGEEDIAHVCRIPTERRQVDKRCFRAQATEIVALTIGEDNIYALGYREGDRGAAKHLFIFDMDGREAQAHPIDGYEEKYGYTRSLRHVEGQVYVLFPQGIGRLNADGEMTMMPWMVEDAYQNDRIVESEGSNLYIIQRHEHEEDGRAPDGHKERMVRYSLDTGEMVVGPEHDWIVAPALRDGLLVYHFYDGRLKGPVYYQMDSETFEGAGGYPWSLKAPVGGFGKWSGASARWLPLPGFDPERDIREHPARSMKDYERE